MPRGTEVAQRAFDYLLRRLSADAEEDETPVETEYEDDYDDVDDQKMANPTTTQPQIGAVNLMYVEDSITKFSSTDPTYTVTKWAQEVEDNAEIFNLTEPQKLLIARRTLTSTAAAWLRSEKTFKTYEELKTAIAKEFPDTLNAEQVHEIMSNRKKRKDETCYDYMLEMKALGKRGKLADYVAIQYIIEGITDNENHKIMLYGVTTYSDLKEKLKIYEAFKKNIKSSASASTGIVASNERNRRQGVQAVRCFNCGTLGHASADCPNRSKGLKCFRCNQFGHIGSQCKFTPFNQQGGAGGGDSAATWRANGATLPTRRDQPVRQYGGDRSEHRPYQRRPNDVNQSVKQLCTRMMSDENEDGGGRTFQLGGPNGNELTRSECMTAAISQDVKQNVNKNFNKNKSEKIVFICGQSVTSLVDSGSDLSLVSTKLYFKLNITSFHKEIVTLTGLGDKRISSLGKFECSISVDGQSFVCTFHIVPDDVMPYDLLLGQDFLSNAVIIINQGSVTVMPRDDCWLNKVCCSVSGVGKPNCLVTDPVIKEQVQQLVSEYTPVKTKEAPIKIKIILTDEIPVAQRPRRLSVVEEKEVEKQIGEWLKDGIIHPSFSEYASPLVLVRKKDGSTRVCIDYRRINNKMIKDEFPLPVIEDHIDKLAHAKVFEPIKMFSL